MRNDVREREILSELHVAEMTLTYVPSRICIGQVWKLLP